MKKYLILLLLLIPSFAWGALVADIAVLPSTTVEVGEEVHFTAEGTTYDTQDLIYKGRYEWDFGDGYSCKFNSGCIGTPNYNVGCQGIQLTHYFMEPGTYTVTLNAKLLEWTVSDRPTVLTVIVDSTTSNTIGTGEKTFYVAPGSLLEVGGYGTIYYYNTGTSTLVTTKYMKATITAYNSTTGEVTVDVACSSGVETYDSWKFYYEKPSVAKDTETVEITVTGKAPITGFEIQRANYNNRIKQNLYIQIPQLYRNNTTQLLVKLLGPGESDTTTLLSKSNLTAEEILLFDQSNLPLGNYVIQAELLDASGDRIVINATTEGIWRDKFYKGYNNTPAVGIDENNNFIIGGHPYFSIFAFMLGSSSYTKYITDAGINTLDTTWSTTDAAGWKSYVDIAGTYGLKVVGPGRGLFHSYPGIFRYNYPSSSISGFASATKDSSNMFLMKWQDEPNGGGDQQKIYLPILGGWAYSAHSGDPNHPSFNLYLTTDWAKYMGTGLRIYDYLKSHELFGGKKWMQDVFSSDTYPMTGRLHPSVNYYDIGIYAAYLDTNRRAITNNKNLVPFIPALQPCKGQITYSWGSITADQLKMELWLNVVLGAKSLGYFNYYYMTDTAPWSTMKDFSDLITSLDHVVLSAPPDRTVSDTANVALNNVETMIREDSATGDIYVIAVRVTEPDPVPSHATVRFTGLANTVIPVGTQVYDSVNDGVWTTLPPLPSDTVAGFIPEGGTTVYLTLAYEEAGPTVAAINTINSLVVPIDGISGVTNTQPAVLGTKYLPDYSFTTLRCAGTPGTVISPQAIVSDTNSKQWRTFEGCTINAGGYCNAYFYAVDSGAIDAEIGTITTIVTAISGWSTVTNQAKPRLGVAGGEPTTLEDVAFTVSGISEASTVEVVGEGRSLSMDSSGVFTDDFDEYDVHIYKITGETTTTYTVTVTKAGTGTGTVLSYPSGVTCGTDCSESYVAGNTITLTATPSTNSDFTGWSGTYGCTGTSTCVVSSIAANAAVTATFTLKETPPTYHNMIVSHTGTGSGVTSPVQGEHSEGEATEVVITATADEGSSFNGWGGTCGCTGSTSPCTIASFPTSDCTVTANFDLDALYTLTVGVSGVESLTSNIVKHCSVDSNGNMTQCTFSAAADEVITISTTCKDGYYGATWSGDVVDGSVTMTEDKVANISCVNGRVIVLGGTGTLTLGSMPPEISGKLGTDNISGFPISLVANRADCWAVQAPSTGTLTAAYAKHSNTSEATAKVCVYSHDGDAPDAGDLKLGCSGAITSSVDEWKSAAMDGGSVISGSNYYMCMFVDNDSANAFSVGSSSNTSTIYYKTISGLYDAPGDTLLTAWSSAMGQRIKSVYVTITP